VEILLGLAFLVVVDVAAGLFGQDSSAVAEARLRAPATPVP
jgi:hypothetical protein